MTTVGAARDEVPVRTALVHACSRTEACVARHVKTDSRVINVNATATDTDDASMEVQGVNARRGGSAEIALFVIVLRDFSGQNWGRVLRVRRGPTKTKRLKGIAIARSVVWANTRRLRATVPSLIALHA